MRIISVDKISEKMFRYKINQFIISSSFKLPAQDIYDNELHLIDRLNPNCKILVDFRPGTLKEISSLHMIAKRPYARCYKVETGVIICITDKVRAHINNAGNHISLDFAVESDYESSVAGAWTINMGVSICSLLKNDLPLHGASVSIDQKLFCIMAPSGTGKTTLLWNLLDNGALFVSDDVLNIQLDKSELLAVPSVSLHSKLTQEEIFSRGMDITSFSPIVPESNEFWIPISNERRLKEAQPLSALFVLQPVENLTHGQVILSRRTGGAATLLLMENIQALWAVYSVLDAKSIFQKISIVAQIVPIYTIRYVRSYDIIPSVIEKMKSVLD